ncbi:hypothetical protein D3C74_381530 [compost metagenome]
MILAHMNIPDKSGAVRRFLRVIPIVKPAVPFAMPAGVALLPLLTSAFMPLMLFLPA